MGDANHLPTKDGWYWVLEDIGISQVKCVCWVTLFPVGNKYFPQGGVYVLSPWSVYSEPLCYNKELHHKQLIPWDSKTHLAWEGPLVFPKKMISVKTGNIMDFSEEGR